MPFPPVNPFDPVSRFKLTHYRVGKRVDEEEQREAVVAAWDDISLHLQDGETVPQMLARLPADLREFVRGKLSAYVTLSE